ncbi:GNAT family N-acetyltransferase [Actinoallomurus spadix]|uniref:GNAT family N-acetyltransferase n=1 Tax=Actinoallomurus spadix TaxID=79912 RepID=A0ABN0X3V2_9ACTN|nr:GNAT family protein [Actinoallomurus spadix]MCO5986070.1 GNAT family N-acetyltransferase [Actinoallomurus spadix]
MRTLTTERLVLPPWDARFEDDLCRLSADPRITRFLGDGRPWDRERALTRHGEILAHWAEHGFGWRGILLRDGGDERTLGVAALNHLRRSVPGIEESVIEIGWWVDPRYWGMGLATEAAAALRDEAFTDHGAERLAALYQPANHASGNVMRKIGMRHHGDTIGPYGEAVRVHVLDRSDWVAMRARPDRAADRTADEA